MLYAKVIPLLFGLELSDVSGPLAQFQAKKVDQSGLMEVVKAINKVSENKTSDDIVKQLVPALWSKLEDLLSRIPEVDSTDKHMRPQTEILEELVAGVRGIAGRTKDFSEDLMERNPRSRRSKFRRIHPMMIDEIALITSDSVDDPIALLMIAGLFRDELPWLSEIMVETYRDIKQGGKKDAEKAANRLHRVMSIARKGPFMDELFGSKDMHIIMMELPHIMDRVLRRYMDNSKVDEEDK